MNLKKRIEKIEIATPGVNGDRARILVDDFLRKISNEALKLMIEWVRGKRDSVPKQELNERFDRVKAALRPQEIPLLRIWKTLKDDELEKIREYMTEGR